ncbi:TIGR04168 family protein [Pseudanabaena sp. PCC 6802]|uniref:TIGR04168 family protein n=1 Tax=Pseudanabaena sp. PCC 6802 TaxID=118173 RepID=UPI0003486C8B|nr:TIGR04168 family protein [Pseudanabaena sp. PCC 6802]
MDSGLSDREIKIAVVGDIHEQWEPEDGIALQRLGVDLVLFVGDFGNESVEVVRAIATLDLPKAVILGNHDAWYTASEWGRRKCPYDRKQEDRLQQQIDLLGHTHVGYSYLDFPNLNLSVVGSRPFSWGSSEWKNAEFYRDRYGIENFEQSTARIAQSVAAAAGEVIIFLGHNGPFGLGDRPTDPCGKDWHPAGGDYGDPDFTEAIAKSRLLCKQIPLVAFGHMHHRLHHTTELRRPIAIDPEGTIYLNAAAVPRIVKTLQQRDRNFSLVSMQGGKVARVSLVWVDRNYSITLEEILYESQVRV